MKKTTCIHLVLITAALAACNRPMYQQEYYSPEYYPGDLPDSTNACPIGYSQLPPDYYNWLYSFRPYGSYYVDPSINIDLYYGHRYRETVVRAGFGGKTTAISS